MTARVLVVDDMSANVKLLETWLTSEYYEVISASSGPEAIEICKAGRCDIVLLDVMMSEMDGFEACRRLKSDAQTSHVPVVMVTALDQPAERARGFEAGADDFLTKPVNGIALLTRIKSLVRLKVLTDELRTRTVVARDMGFDDGTSGLLDEAIGPASILLIDDERLTHVKPLSILRKEHNVHAASDTRAILSDAAENKYDMVICNLSAAKFDGLRLCSQIRSLDACRMLPILLITSPDEEMLLQRGLEINVTDYVVRPLDIYELRARIRTQLRCKFYYDRQSASYRLAIEMATIDQLTGLHNRRHLEKHLSMLISASIRNGQTLSVLFLDVDFFKAINDTYGHDVGDEVLKELATRIKINVRSIDMVGRFGGEEFVVVLPDANATTTHVIAERLREVVDGEPFKATGTLRPLSVTVSIGMASLNGLGDSMSKILKRADQGLYEAKQDGRNKVVMIAA